MAFDDKQFPVLNNKAISALYTCPEDECARRLAASARLSETDRRQIEANARDMVEELRGDAPRPGPVDALLQEYGLSTAEGVSLMRLSEALIRTPDFATARRLVRDKLAPGGWSGHLGADRPAVVNAASAGLALATRWIAVSGGATASGVAARLGDRALVAAVERAMALIGEHFVLGESISDALQRGRRYAQKGYAFSFDMLGEAARTHADAQAYFDKYIQAAEAVALAGTEGNNRSAAPSPNNISVKLSALHPRYEFNTLAECGPALVEKLGAIAAVARRGGFSITIDAEEADRLEASLAVFEQALAHEAIAGWDGLGLVVQAYQKRAPAVIDWIVDTARRTGRRIPVRLVKGAYWDTEIKRAQEMGLADYPVFTEKAHTDLSYIACARQLLDAGDDAVFAQFATHNAHSAAAILHMAGDARGFEFQRLHGMGEALHDRLIGAAGATSRVYAPVGRHKELLPYLVRRLLENGANSSFVNQVHDQDADLGAIVADPITKSQAASFAPNPAIAAPRDHLLGRRLAAPGVDWTLGAMAARLEQAAADAPAVDAACIVNGEHCGRPEQRCVSPADTRRDIGAARLADGAIAAQAADAAARSRWAVETTAEQRAEILRRAAVLLDKEQDRFIGLCVAEAGKTIPDAIAEIREAIDFLTYYADEAASARIAGRAPLGVVACISPWNFPLAIFLGQVCAALSVGNAVIAKPADQTPLIAFEAVKLLHRAGVAADALHLLLGSGAEVGEALIRDPRVAGVCFTGSTGTAMRIARNLADTGRGDAPLIAETGGVNAMIIDSTALLEQAIGDVVDSAFQSAGQRCSACRIVAVQDDIADAFETMLRGAVETLSLGDPKFLKTDIGPVVDRAAREKISSYIDKKKAEWPVIAEGAPPASSADGHFIAPVAFRVPSIADVAEEIFGPVLHVVSFAADREMQVVDEVNALGFGLTMGLHTRIDSRADAVASHAKVGNLYVNRNQIGAVVGVQPFGGEGLSGTGPKAGGPHYLLRLTRGARAAARDLRETDAPSAAAPLEPRMSDNAGPDDAGPDAFAVVAARAAAAQANWSRSADIEARLTVARTLAPALETPAAETLRAASDAGLPLPGPTGETNTLRLAPRGVLASFPPRGNDAALLPIARALAAGNAVILLTGDAEEEKRARDILARVGSAPLPDGLLATCAAGALGPETLRAGGVAGLMAGRSDAGRAVALAAPGRLEGAILPVLSPDDPFERYSLERVVTVDTTAAGGNASLLANS